MLETTRKRGASILIYLVFGMLIVIFVVNFGTQSVGAREGCHGTGADTMVSIEGDSYGMNTWRYAYNGTGMLRGIGGEQKTIVALDGLVRREMLAQEAERRGLAISEDAIDQKIKTGEVYWLGRRVPGIHYFFGDGDSEDLKHPDVCPEEKKAADCFFVYDYLNRWISAQFGIGIGAFKSEQRRELLALAMQDILASGAHASKDEAYAEWLHDELTVTASVVPFKADEYAKKMVLSDADVDRFLDEHAAEVKKKYDDDKAADYTGVPAQVHLRRVFVKKAEKKEDKKEEKKETGTGTGSGGGSQDAKPAEDPGKHALELARQEIVGKKKTLAEVAKELDSDDAIKAKGGDLGWMPKDTPTLPSPEFAAAVAKLKPGGEPSDVLEGPDGWWLLEDVEERSGDLSFDQVKRDIASKMAIDVWSKEAARRAAIHALAEAKASGKPLTDLYEKAPSAAPPQQPGGPNQKITPEMIKQRLQDPNLKPEERQILEQLLQQVEGGATGMADHWESPTQLASWTGDDAAKPADASAAPPAPAPPKPEDLMKESADKLPTITIDKPKVETVGPIPRDEKQVGAIGKSPELVKALFDDLKDGQLADTIFQVRASSSDGFDIDAPTWYVVVQLVTRAQPKRADFEKDAEGYVESLQQTRASALVKTWLTAKCSEVTAAKEIRIDNSILTTHDDKGQTKTIPYAACSTF